MSYFPDNVLVEVFTMVEGVPTWTNIGGSIVSPIRVQSGFSDGQPLSRLAPGGDMRFDLNNINGDYDPSATFYKGQKIRLRVKYGSLVKTKFFGYIDLITLDVGTWGNRQAHVTCIDWLGLAAKTPIRALPGLTNTTVDVAVTALLTQMQTQPENTDFEAGDITLPYVFDQITTNSTVYSELQNLVMGEWGYIYMRDGGETLKIENSLSRTGDGSDYKTTNFYLPDGVEEDFLLEDGTNFLLEDGTNFLLEGEPTAASFDSDMGETYRADLQNGISIVHGDNLTNKINASAVPVVIGGSTQVLYPFNIANGSKAILVPSNSEATPYIIQGQYKDPTAGGSQVSGSSVVTPVVSTDWTFNSKADGTGTDLSANITITFTAGASGFKASIVNTGASGYITKFNVRGVPVYRYSPVETVIQDQRSIWDYGDYTLQFIRQYGASSDDVRPYLFRLLMRDRKPRTIVSNPKFLAMDSLDHLAGFLALDIGDQIRLSSTKPESDALYYIQGVKFVIMPGSEQITYDYITAETMSGSIVGITESAVEQTSSDQYIDFGILNNITDLTYISITARIYISALPIIRYLFGIRYRSGISVTPITAGNNAIGYFKRHTVSDGVWRQNTSYFGDNTWVDIVVTYDSRLTTNDPLIYINGSLVSTTESSTPSGTPEVEAGQAVSIGNASSSSTYGAGVLGKYENIAIYNRILTAAEISTIHNGGTRLPFASYPMSGLKFFFGGMDDDSYTAKLDSTLGSLDTVYDLVNGFTGQPIGSPTLRAVG